MSYKIHRGATDFLINPNKEQLYKSVGGNVTLHLTSFWHRLSRNFSIASFPFDIQLSFRISHAHWSGILYDLFEYISKETTTSEKLITKIQFESEPGDHPDLAYTDKSIIVAANISAFGEVFNVFAASPDLIWTWRRRNWRETEEQDTQHTKYKRPSPYQR